MGPLGRIIGFSLRRRGIVIALASLFCLYGLYSLSRASYDVFPEFAPPQVVIQTEAPGLSPEQVEMLVTQPVENAVNGVPGVESLRSGSMQGISVITVTFHGGSDIYRDRQVVAERLALVAGSLPEGVRPPAMTPLTSSTSIVLGMGLTSGKRSLMELRTVADWTVRQRLLAVPGVAKVAVFGGETRQVQIQINPDVLIRNNLVVEDVLAAARRATGVRGGGFIDTANQRIVLQTGGQSLTPAELGQTVVLQRAGAVLRLEDVARVTYGPEPPFSAAAVMGKVGVVLMVSAQYGANTLQVAERLDRALDELRTTLEAEGIRLHTDIFRPANFIRTATGNVRSSLLIGAVLVGIIIFLFLRNWRAAVISCTAIPLSLLATVTVLERMGLSLNTMTLGGLAIAIGEVVDDAIVDVQNITRRLEENRCREVPLPSWRIVLDASLEVRSAVVYATFAVVLVFVPVVTMSGLAGRIFAPLGFAYILAVLASLFVALTLTPALCLVMLPRGGTGEKAPPVEAQPKTWYGAVLTAAMNHPRTVLASVLLLTVIGAAALPFFRADFLPELREGHFILHMSAVPGTSLAESVRLGERVTRALLQIPAVRSVAQRVGRAELGDDILGTQDSEFEVDLKPLSGEESERAETRIREAIAPFAGVNFALTTFLSERVEETLSGYAAPVVVNIYGNDLDQLDKTAQDVARILGKVDGAAGIKIQAPQGMPQLNVRLEKKS